MPSIDFARPTVAARLLAACLSLACAATAAPTITDLNLGALPGRVTLALAISDDGAAVAGASVSTTGTGNRAFRWTSAGGQQLLGALPAQIGSFGNAISADGWTVVGTSGNPAPDLAFRWTQAGGMTALAMPPTFTQSRAQGVSRDGSVVVGAMYASQTFFRAFRWTASGGAQDLGVLPGQPNSSASAVSRDGSAVAGYSGNRSFRWLAGVGMQDIGVLPGTTQTAANAISADGMTVVGVMYYTGTSRAFRWTSNDGVQDLHDSTFGLQASGEARAVSGNGSVVVGSAFSTGGSVAFLWTRSLGMVDFNAYLVGLGVDLTGWTLTDANGISADGTAIVGTGSFNGLQRAYVVRGLPRDCRADVTGDGRVDFADLNRVLAEYGTTCP